MKRMNLPRHRILRLSPWFLMGAALILGLVVLIMAARDTRRERERMAQHLTDRAAALIWALEAGSRTRMAMRAGSPYLQLLLEETAKQPGIVYMAVTDGEGKILAHSELAETIDHFADPESIAALDASDSPQWRIVDGPDELRIFEVYKVFSPVAGRRHSGHGRRADESLRRDAADPAPEGSRVIFAGLDARPFEEALASDFRNTVLSSLLVALVAFGAFVSLFWAHNYRVSRRMLQDAEAFAAEMVGSLPLGLCTSNPAGRIVLANAAVAELFGVDRKILPGLPLRTLGKLDWESLLADLEQGAPVLEREMSLARPDGTMQPVSVSASKILNEDQIFLGYLFIMRDLAEIRHLQQQLRRSERLSALGNLAAGVAHEVRNPLSSIKGFATYLLGKADKGGAADAAKMLVQEVDRLNRVVSGLLEFARPDTMRLAPTALASVLERALSLCASDAADKDIAVRVASAPDLPLIAADADRLTQALLNLFLNAIQAMDKGGALDISSSHDRGTGKILLHIADTG
ncbi:MAG: PAS domain-containing protein, partial [Deltaproteobacteria bacterium]|nr:PAS domain-containing protein [Deltaproteobacteria bacterium]